MEVWFYHLQRRPLESALPALVARTLANGWTAVIQATSPERLAALDDLLWTYDDQSFVAHGSARDGDGPMQPVWLTLETDNPNAASVRFFAEGADVVAALANESVRPRERAIVMFDGRDEEQVAVARDWWRALKTRAAAVTYWRQNGDGRWEKKA